MIFQITDGASCHPGINVFGAGRWDRVMYVYYALV